MREGEGVRVGQGGWGRVGAGGIKREREGGRG